MGMRSKAATSQAAFIRIASPWRTAAAPANASNRGKADQKALNLGCRHPSLHRSTLERGQEYARRNDGARRLQIFPAVPKAGRDKHLDVAHLRARVREGRKKTLYGSKGRFFPHPPDKSLILRKSRTISSESRLFNGLRGINRAKIFLGRFLRSERPEGETRGSRDHADVQNRSWASLA